jgi:hypothetical protein
MKLTPVQIEAVEEAFGADCWARFADCMPVVVVTPAMHRAFLGLP